MISDWRDLPFPEIWVVDTEYYPGPGLAMAAETEIRSLRFVWLRWKCERVGSFACGGIPVSPYSIGPDSVVMGYMASAELGTHLALGWSQPANVLDPYIEFRHCTNDGSVEPEDREKGFYGLDGALRYFLEDPIDSAHKQDMRDRILQGPPFTCVERAGILDYCETTLALLHA